MIGNQSRAGYIGASDTKWVMRKNRMSQSYKNWWSVKLGADPQFYGNEFTRAGNMWEHSILTAVNPQIDFDRTIILDNRKMLLRVNYDGNTAHSIYEVKTHKNDHDFELTKEYWMQAQVQMFAWKYANEHGLPDTNFGEVEELESLTVVSYALTPADVYRDFDDDEAYAGKMLVDKDRLQYHEVEYDKAWIKGEYLQNLKELSKYLRKGQYPA